MDKKIISPTKNKRKEYKRERIDGSLNLSERHMIKKILGQADEW